MRKLHMNYPSTQLKYWLRHSEITAFDLTVYCPEIAQSVIVRGKAYGSYSAVYSARVWPNPILNELVMVNNINDGEDTR